MQIKESKPIYVIDRQGLGIFFYGFSGRGKEEILFGAAVVVEVVVDVVVEVVVDVVVVVVGVDLVVEHHNSAHHGLQVGQLLVQLSG